MGYLNSRSASIKVRARAVDMLGRQQIAGIPTALHELFKNAYDAFARRVEVDVLVKNRALILRDNGYGMTEDEFRNRWLTLGTESKVGQSEMRAPWLGEFGEVPRRILGEKGIGRLAIAAIGPAVLVMTRSNKEAQGLGELVVCLIHWGLFEIPGIDLDRIRVPVVTLPGGTLPDKALMNSLVDDVIAGMDVLGDELPEADRQRITGDLELMRVPTDSIFSKLEGNEDSGDGPLSLEGDGFGTHFLVRPYDDVLDADLASESEGEVSRLRKLLIGFGNTMLPDLPPPPIKATFRVKHLNDDVVDYIGDKAFFNPDEFLTADHIFKGRFDDYGQFSGEVKVFDRNPVPYSLNWPGAKGKPTDCGSFEIQFAVVQGLQHQSMLAPDDWVDMIAKLNAAGGLYIYRDGVRVLPYGDADFDFLHIEKRRTLKGSDWFFSFRRMFGAILVSSRDNPALKDKAGREGFRENIAYHQFREMLENLLQQLAKDFFRKEAQFTEYNDIRTEMDARNDLLKKREKLVAVKKDKFKNELSSFFERVEAGDPGSDVDAFGQRLMTRLDAIERIDDPDAMGVDLHRAEAEFRDGLERLRGEYRVRRPQGIGLTKQLTSDWQAYRRVSAELEAECFMPLAAEFEKRMSLLLERRGAELDRRAMLRETLEQRTSSIEKAVSRSKSNAQEGLHKARDSVTKGISESVRRLHNEIATVLSDFERTKISEFDSAELQSVRAMLEGRLDDVSQRETNFLERLREQMDALSEAVDAGVLPDDVVSALEDSNQQLIEEMEESLQWAQVGMALGVVQHEFNGVVRNVRKGIRELRPWAAGTPELRNLFDDLRTGFSHLEGYLKLFAPLERRTRRERVELTGEDIRAYVVSVFEARFARHDIKLRLTEEFRRFVVEVFPSTLLPVFINVVDNACHWLAEATPDRRWIEFDANENGVVISNGGPGIEKRLAERIFDFGYSTKKNGRGMGLSIARRALRHEGMDISIIDPGLENSPRFQITVGKQDKQGD
ncbi:MAG: ATP-binding protein [Thiobacillus sp.]|nr:ATP-binding protein [Thiobacillus sp.]